MLITTLLAVLLAVAGLFWARRAGPAAAAGPGWLRGLGGLWGMGLALLGAVLLVLGWNGLLGAALAVWGCGLAVLTVYALTLCTTISAVLLYHVHRTSGAVMILIQLLVTFGIITILEAAGRAHEGRRQ